MSRVRLRSVSALAWLALASLAPLARPHAATPQAPSPAASPRTAAPSAGARSPRTASYTIDARLDPSTRTLSGDQVLTWRNETANPATTLRFHLYYNAWRNTASTWMREHRVTGDPALDRRPESDWGWIEIDTVQAGSQGAAPTDLTSQLRFIAPDDGNADDRTVVEVPLSSPVAPGQTIDVRMTWRSRVPRTFARTGTVGSYYFIAQWFPKIGVLQDTGWNCHQFHATTEFFSDFGNYDVRLRVPSGWIVGATGVERERRDQPDGSTVHRYVQDDVHDFAWTASPDYLEAFDTFTHATLPSVRIRLLLQPEHRGQERRHFEATKAALKNYGEWFGPYPYGHVTVVDPAWQSGAGGMEYPTLFTAGTRWLAPGRGTQPESVTIHEAGHQFWYGVVATNEFEHAWMDEGFNTFSTSRVLAEAFEPRYLVRRYFGGFVPWVFRDLPVSRDRGNRSVVEYRLGPGADAQDVPSWQYWPGTAGPTTYHKTALWLHTLERMLGWPTLQRILSAYFQRGSFRHPTPEDFFAVANEVSGRDLTGFFDQAHRSSAEFDYGVGDFRSGPAGGRGYEGTPPAFREQPAAGTAYRTTVVARRFGDGVFPIDVRVVFENNEEVRWQWDGRARWKVFEVDKPVRAVRADVDPDRILMLDVNRTNNSAVSSPAASRAARKWSLVWLIWLQDHLLTYGFFV